MNQFRPKPTRKVHRRLGFLFTLFLIITGCIPPPVTHLPAVVPDVSVPLDGYASIDPGGDTVERFCPDIPKPRIVEIREANPQVDKQHHDLMRHVLTETVAITNTTILLGPEVVLDFSDASDDAIPLEFAPCVTLTSASAFAPDTALPNAGGSITEESSDAMPPDSAFLARPNPDDTTLGGTPQPARSPHSLGPLLKFGPHRSREERIFLLVHCAAGSPPSDNVRISGFRLYGPSFDQQNVEDIGIRIFRCLNIEISNMEIAGWGGQGIQVLDDPAQGPGQEQPNNLPGERIGRPEQIRIFNNYIHHNQHPTQADVSVGIKCLLIFCITYPKISGHAAGYGVEVDHGAWAQVYENVFDFNRHAIAAAGDTGGYEAGRNLVLKGGGLHYEPLDWHTHQFDIHGSGDNGFGGQAGVQSWFLENSFQYLDGAAIKIRGRPHLRIYIRDNVFAHEGLEDDEGDDAIHVDDRDDLDVIELGPNNVIDSDSYGRYGVCDFDGDGIDDLFLATGKTWWFSSFGEFQWTYLSERTERLDQVRLGYFDEDQRCDVLAESGADWVIASGGTGAWQSIGAFDAPLSEVAFGRFDPNIRDHRPGVTKRTTHAFMRERSGEWLVTPLSSPAWQHAQSSSLPMSKLRFGDFTGDGVTDVLAVQSGRWSISQSANSGWQRLNQHLSDDVSSLFIADLDNNNIDDLIRLEADGKKITWWVSDDGRSRWRQLKTYTFPDLASATIPIFTFAGRFGAAPGGGVLLIDHHRTGHFYSEAEIATGAAPDWTSLFSY